MTFPPLAGLHSLPWSSDSCGSLCLPKRRDVRVPPRLSLGHAQVPSSPEGLWSRHCHLPSAGPASSRTSDPSPLSLAVSVKATAWSPPQGAAVLWAHQPLLLCPAQAPGSSVPAWTTGPPPLAARHVCTCTSKFHA